MKYNKYTFIPLLLIIFIIIACEESRFTPFDSILQPPHLKNLHLTKYIIDTDTIRLNNQFSINDTITIFNTVELFAYDPDGFNDIQEIKYSVIRDTDNKQMLEGILYPLIIIPHNEDTNYIKFDGIISLKIPRKIVGKFYVSVVGYDRSRNRSNMLTTSFSIIRSGKPPLLTDLRAPDTVYLPGSGSKIINISVKATDENNDIKEVYFKSLDSSDPNRKFFLYDSGNLTLHGDSLANDGIYSILIELPYNITPKPYRFEFEAKDYTELLSNKILHTIIVVKQ